MCAAGDFIRWHHRGVGTEAGFEEESDLEGEPGRPLSGRTFSRTSEEHDAEQKMMQGQEGSSFPALSS